MEVIAVVNSKMEDLFCIESLGAELDQSNSRNSICVNSMMDPVLLTDSRVLENMLNDERTVTKHDYCSSVQGHIAPHMRKIVTEWMLDVCEGFRRIAHWIYIRSQWEYCKN